MEKDSECVIFFQGQVVENLEDKENLVEELLDHCKICGWKEVEVMIYYPRALDTRNYRLMGSLDILCQTCYTKYLFGEGLITGGTVVDRKDNEEVIN